VIPTALWPEPNTFCLSVWTHHIFQTRGYQYLCSTISILL